MTFDVKLNINASTRADDQDRRLFLSEVDDDASKMFICAEEDFILEGSALDFVTSVREAMGGEPRVVASDSGYFKISDSSLLVQVRADRAGTPGKVVRARRFATFTGQASRVLQVQKRLHDQYASERLSMVRWCFVTKDGLDWRTIVIDPPKPVLSEFYPWIQEGVESYLDRYFHSNSGLLFLMGEPGTGKTSLVRHFIHKYHLGAVVTYEEKLLDTDSLFVNFMFGEDETVMVIEDADLMLTSREMQKNRMVARFLNVADGLVKFPGKKIIFTTNLGDFKDVDPALTRPGRCFDTMKFRSLTLHEAEAAALAAGVPEPKEACTLARLFNPDWIAPDPVVVGFKPQKSDKPPFPGARPATARGGRIPTPRFTR